MPIETTVFFSGEVIHPSPVPSGIWRQSYVGCAFQMPPLEPVYVVSGRAVGSAT